MSIDLEATSLHWKREGEGERERERERGEGEHNVDKGEENTVYKRMYCINCIYSRHTEKS